MTHRELTCQELVELVTDYLENVLPLEERARFETHLAGCEGCRAYLDQMKAVIRMSGRLAEQDIAPPVRNELLGLFRNWKKS